MIDKPLLDRNLKKEIFLSTYFLKEELVNFCKKENLQTTGNKPELAERIAIYLETGERSTVKHHSKKNNIGNYSLDLIIGPNPVCSQKCREFFIEQIKGFAFNVPFLNWLRSNPEKTYGDSINAYYIIKIDIKNRKTDIGKQFEYNTYVREFFKDNKKMTLQNAVDCWNYKKKQNGSHAYARSDLSAIKNKF